MNCLTFRLRCLLIALLTVISSDVNEGACQSREDAESVIRFVPKETSFVVVFRPRQLLYSGGYRQHAGKNPNLNQLINRMTREWFQFGLAEFRDIEYVVQIQSRV